MELFLLLAVGLGFTSFFIDDADDAAQEDGEETNNTSAVNDVDPPYGIDVSLPREDGDEVSTKQVDIATLSNGEDVEGTCGDDIIEGENFSASLGVIDAKEGDDIIHVTGAFAAVNGGDGDDEINVSGLDPTQPVDVSGGDGDDILVSSHGGANLSGDEGNDQFRIELSEGLFAPTEHSGGAGDDTFEVTLKDSQFTEFAPTQLSGGTGEDSFLIRTQDAELIAEREYQEHFIENSRPIEEWVEAEAEGTPHTGVALQIDDFTPGEDKLVIDSITDQERFLLKEVELIEDGEGTSVVLLFALDDDAEYRGVSNYTTTVRLENAFGLAIEDINIRGLGDGEVEPVNN